MSPLLNQYITSINNSIEFPFLDRIDPPSFVADSGLRQAARREPFGPEPVESLQVERLKAEGLADTSQAPSLSMGYKENKKILPVESL